LKVFCLVWLVGFLFIPLSSEALALGGYNKTIFSLFPNPRAKSYYIALNRQRFDIKESINPYLSAEVIVDNEAVIGPFLRKKEFDAFKKTRLAAPVNNAITVVDSSLVFDRLVFHRFSATVANDPYVVTLGHQRVALGRGTFYSPTDYFNPANPLSIENERAGFQGINFLGYNNEFSFFQIIGSLDRDWKLNRYALKYQANVKAIDVAFMVGKNAGSAIIGGDSAFNLYDGVMRIESLIYLTDPNVDLIINYDRSFGEGWYGLVEYIYHSGGESDRKRVVGGIVQPVLPARVRSSTVGLWQPLARYYLGTSISKQITPLMGISFSLLTSLVDNSMFVNANILNNLAANWDLQTGGTVSIGDRTTEFGQYSGFYFSSLQFSF